MSVDAPRIFPGFSRDFIAKRVVLAAVVLVATVAASCAASWAARA
jgi:hypothetical protein